MRVKLSKRAENAVARIDARWLASADHPDVDSTAWSIHGQIHQRLPQARAVLHLHPVYTTAVACLAKPHVPPIDQNTARYFNRVAVDELAAELRRQRYADRAAGGHPAVPPDLAMTAS